MKKLSDFLNLELEAFDVAQRIIVASLIEEVEWLKERVTQLERLRGEEILTSAIDPYREEG